MAEQSYTWRISMNPTIADTPESIEGGAGTIGVAINGIPIYTPFEYANAAFTGFVELASSYEKTSDATAAWEAHEYIEGSGDLDECNGKYLDDGSYAYFATTSFPYMMGCIIGDQLNNP